MAYQINLLRMKGHMLIRTFSCIICLYSLAEKGWGVLHKKNDFPYFRVNNFVLTQNTEIYFVVFSIAHCINWGNFKSLAQI